jgi:beta-phosphoglucomutase-like phosphatase (HAD superfamily)
LNLDPKDCVVIEDSPSGASAGRAAGCIVVATTFSHSAEELAVANYRIKDLTGVKASILPGGEGLQLKFTPSSME